MNSNVFIIDIGNTNTKISLCDCNTKSIIKTLRISNNKLLNNKKKINSFLKKQSESNIVIGSVNRIVLNKLKKILNSLKLKNNIIYLTYKDFPKYLLINIKEKYENIGLDILSLSYYQSVNYKSSLGICFGTATFAIVYNETIKGVVICPNFLSSIKNMIKNVNLINSIKLSSILTTYGLNTMECLESGYFHSINGFISSIVKKSIQNENIKDVIICGGIDFDLNVIDKHNNINYHYNEKEIITIGYLYLYINNLKK